MDRTAENARLVASGRLVTALPFGFAMLPFTLANVLMICCMGLATGMGFWRGMRARRHRLHRQKEIDALRARLFGDDT